jgi:DNA polymerase III delta prime subunit
MRLLPKKVNLFFRHLLTSKQEPFSEVSEESLEPYGVTMDTNRTRFYFVLQLILRHLYPSPSYDESFRTEYFKGFGNRDLLLFEFSDSLNLKVTLNLFESNDMRADARYSELVLVFLSAVDFDFDTVLQLFQSVHRRNWETDLVRNGIKISRKVLPKRNNQAKQQACRQQARQMDFTSIVLSMDLNFVDKKALKPIQTHWVPFTEGAKEETEEQYVSNCRAQYFNQFKGPILEEIRAEMQQKRNALENRRGTDKCIVLTINLEEDNKSEDTLVSFSCDIVDLPKFDHNPMMEVVELFNPKHPKEQVRALLDHFNYDKKTKKCSSCKMNVLQSLATKLSKNLKLKAYPLVGLTSFARQYEVCMFPPRSAIVNSMIFANIQPWSEEYLFQASGQVLRDHLLLVLNDVQADVVAEFVHATHGQYLLQGPPGTGKTTTIVKLLVTLLDWKTNQRIMVCAPSNAAVQHLAKCAFQQYGSRVSMALSCVVKGMDQILMPIYVGQLKEQLRNELDDSITSLMKYPLQPALDAVVSRCFEKVKDLFVFVSSVQSRIAAARFDYKLTNKQDVDKVIKRLVAAHGNFSSAYGEFISHISTSELSSEAIVKLIESLTECRTAIDESKDSIEIFLLSQSQIIFCTLTTAGRPYLRKHIPGVDVLIIDEAGQATEPELLIPYAFGPQKCIQVGDSKQLPATIVSKTNCLKVGYDQSIMSRLLDRCGLRAPRLRVQHRMHAAICRFPSHQYYDNELVPAPFIANRSSPLLGCGLAGMLLSPCVYIDVPSRERTGETKISTQHTSISNKHEADITLQLLDHVLEHLPAGCSVGVITFYTAQRDDLVNGTHKLRNKSKRSSVQISTVDGFQGQEKDIIILSKVRTVSSGGFLADFRRINVALTRAKHHLYVLGDKSAWTDDEANTDFKVMVPFWVKHGEMGIHMTTEADLVAAIA